MEVADRIYELLRAHRAVTDVALVGSRARGTATRLSDWDFRVESDDFEALASDLPGLLDGLDPLASLWDPLSGESCYMLILEGPTKVDLIFDHPHVNEPPWAVNADTLQAIDAHFWDWILWLCAKQAARKTELVESELRKLFQHLLEPMGAVQIPATLGDAVEVYQHLVAEREAQLGVAVPGRLGEAVSGVVASL